MNADELRDALRQLDRLYEQMNSVQAMLLGDNGARATYEQISARIEAAFPGMSALYVTLAYRVRHGLFPSQ